MMNEGTKQTRGRTIHARVDDNAIERVTRFFNARLGSILGELFQNARRAGATEIDVRTTMTGIEVSDNGHGMNEGTKQTRGRTMPTRRWCSRSAEASGTAGTKKTPPEWGATRWRDTQPRSRHGPQTSRRRGARH